MLTLDPYFLNAGINIFLDGYVPTENLRFRENSLVFKVSETAEEEEIKRIAHYKYPNMSKTLGRFIAYDSVYSGSKMWMGIPDHESPVPTNVWTARLPVHCNVII